MNNKKDECPIYYPEYVRNTGHIDTLRFESPQRGLMECDVFMTSPEHQEIHTPTIIVPGFTEGIVQDAKFAKALSDSMGGDVLVLGQYVRINKRFIGPEEAVNNQVEVLLGLIRQVGTTHKPVNIVTSSMGSIVFAAAAEKAHELGWSCFEDNANVVFISPAGTKLDEKKTKLLKRFIKESMSSGKDDWDQEALDAGPNLVKIDPKKYLSEGLATQKQSIDYKRLQELGITPSVITNPKDALLGQAALGASIEELLESGRLETWTTPWAHSSNLGSDDTTNDSTRHNAHMVNESSAQRTAAAAARLLMDNLIKNH